jgi:hypothetical protein
VEGLNFSDLESDLKSEEEMGGKLGLGERIS